MEWNEVKAKPKKKKAPKPEHEGVSYGGKGAKGKLIAGPIDNGQMAHSSGYDDLDGYGGHDPGQASGLVDFYDEQEVDYYEDQGVEKVSHTCAQAVAQARMTAKMSQDDLAKKIGEKSSMIVDIENASAPYKANVINAIEKALNVQIARGRKKNKKKK